MPAIYTYHNDSIFTPLIVSDTLVNSTSRAINSVGGIIQTFYIVQLSKRNESLEICSSLEQYNFTRLK